MERTLLLKFDRIKHYTEVKILGTTMSDGKDTSSDSEYQFPFLFHVWATYRLHKKFYFNKLDAKLSA